MFVLSQTVALPFTARDHYSPAEFSDPARRWVEGFSTGVAGSIQLKVLSIIIAACTSWLVGNWWIALIIMFGAYLMIGKSFAMLHAAQKPEHFNGTAGKHDTDASLSNLARLMTKGVAAYIVGSAALVYLLFTYGSLEPGNWHGWVGLILGVTFQVTLESLFG